MCRHKHGKHYLFAEVKREEGHWEEVEGLASNTLPYLEAQDEDLDVILTFECNCGYSFEKELPCSKVALYIQEHEEALCRL